MCSATVEPEDIDDIATALNRIVDRPALAARLAERGFPRAAGFGWDAMTPGLVTSWRKALGLSDHQPGGQTQQSPE
jgi:glycosyltransferase involved in cell wall biosynthesis